MDLCRLDEAEALEAMAAKMETAAEEGNKAIAVCCEGGRCMLKLWCRQRSKLKPELKTLKLRGVQ